MATATGSGRGQLSHASSICSEFDPTSLLANHDVKQNPDDEIDVALPKLPMPPDGYNALFLILWGPRGRNVMPNFCFFANFFARNLTRA